MSVFTVWVMFTVLNDFRDKSRVLRGVTAVIEEARD